MPLIVTGSIGIDTVHTPNANVERVLGGSCSYFAAAASLWTPVRLLAAVGGDWPDEHRALLESFEGIDLRGLEVRENGHTFAWGGRYFEDMNSRETLFTELGVLEEHGPEVPDAYRDSEYVFLANTHPAEQLRLLDHFPNRRIAVADTMDLWINIARDELMQMLSQVDGVVLNDEEAFQLTEIRNPMTAGRAILDLGPTFVVVKKGEHGAVLVHKDGIGTLPAYPAEAHQVIDPTGAGDSFAGGMMGHLAANGACDFDAIHASLAWATVTASFTIESFSLERLGRLERSELDDRLELFRRAARIG